MASMKENFENKPNEKNKESFNNAKSVEEFFANSVILITGGTGFVGKALLEKLLRCCPRISAVYILIRCNNRETIEQRFQKFIKNPIFSKCAAALKKISFVKGNLSGENLELDESDRLLIINKVNIVFHVAATIRFDEELKIAVDTNIKGTKNIINLCSEMLNLVSIVHVSTAFSNANLRDEVINEKIYKTNIKPDALIKLCENSGNDEIKKMEKNLLNKHPNTYTFSKHFAENVVHDCAEIARVPIAIVRPSIVCAGLQEPLPGWIDNLGGVTPVLILTGRGILQSLICDKNLIVDVVPVDHVVDTLICAAWYVAEHEKFEKIKVYNCVSGSSNSLTWGELIDLVKINARKYPSKLTIGYSNLSTTTNQLKYNFIAIFCHYLPAFIFDFIRKCRGQKVCLVKFTKRYEQILDVSKYFTCREWNFHDKNMKELDKWINKNASDSDNYNVDIKTLDWKQYFDTYAVGVNKYILHENADDLITGRERMIKLHWIRKFIQVILLILLIKCITPYLLEIFD